MAILRSTTNGDFASASTWNVVDPTSANDLLVPAASVTLTTTPTDRGNFVPGAITINAYAIKFYYRTATPSGTLTLVLRNVTDSVDVANTSVTINVSDLQSRGGVSYLLYSSWIWVPTNGNVTLTAGKTYAVRTSTSVGNQVTIMGTTATNCYRMLSTTTTQAPANGDTLFITGLKTGAGTNSANVVTMSETSTTNYYGTRSAVGITICCHGTLQYNYSASTNYYLKVRGEIGVGSEGTLTIGTATNPIPATSTAVLEFDCAAVQDSGLWVDDYGTFETRGSSLYANGYRSRLVSDIGGICNTAGTAVTRVTGQGYTGLTGTVKINGTNRTISSVTNDNQLVLTASAGTLNNVIFIPAGITAITTSTSTGWLNGESIAIFRGSATTTDYGEQFTLSGNAVGTAITLNTAIVNQKDTSGDPDWQCEIVNFTRNVKIRGVSATLLGYVIARSRAVKNVWHTEFYWLGNLVTPTASKHTVLSYGTVFDNASGGTSEIHYCSFHDYGAYVPYLLTTVTDNGGANWSNLDLFRVVLYTAASTSLLANTMSHIWIGGDCTAYMYNCNDQWSNFRSSVGILFFSDNSINTGNAFFKDSYVHSTSYALRTSQIVPLLIDNVRLNRCNGYAFYLITDSNLTVQNCVVTGCSGITTMAKAISKTVFKNCTFDGEVGYPALYGIVHIATLVDGSYFSNCSFGTTVPHVTGAIYNAYPNAQDLFENCSFGGTMIYRAGRDDEKVGMSLKFQRLNGVVGDNREYNAYGTKQTDTTIYRTASPSQRLTPISATVKYQSDKASAAVNIGETLTFSCWVRCSASPDTVYNGNRPRLVLLANPSAGVLVDTVLDTATSASEGAWELLSGTTPASEDDTAFQVVVDCDGDAGFLNLDDFGVSD